MATLPISNAMQSIKFSATEPAGIALQLQEQLREHYGRIRDIRDASLGEVWRIARDLVVAIDRWAQLWGEVSGATRMEIAVEVIWRFVQERGGLQAIRDLITREVQIPVIGAVARWVASQLVTERVARRLIRLILELAVREIREIAN